MKDFTICVYSFNGHQNNLIPLLSSIRQFVSPSAEVVLVWDDYVRERVIDFDDIQLKSKCNFRLIKQSEIYDWPQSIGEWGWVKQQLAKLLCFSYVNTPYCWICDSDIKITSQLDLFSNLGLPYLTFTDDNIDNENNGYYDFIEKFYKLTVHNKIICNGGGNAVFDRIIIEHMLADCLSKNKKNLVECVASVINSGGPDKNKSNLYPFSEFETYGNYALTYFQERFEPCKPNWRRQSHIESNQHAPCHISNSINKSYPIVLL